MNPYKIIPYIRLSLFRQCPTSPWEIPNRTIPDHEFVLIVGGEGVVTIEGQRFAAKPGTLFYFYPGLHNALESKPSNPMSFYAIHFSFTFFEYQNSLWTLETAAPVLPLKPVIQTGNHVRIANLMKELNTLWNKKDIGYELICSGLFMQVFYCFLQSFNESSPNDASMLKVNRVIRYIEENLSRNITVKELAGLTDVSPDYLCSIFRKHTGYSLIQYINVHRIDKAKQILLGSGSKVKDIALSLGYKDEFYFSRMFKKYEGISPVKFREKTGSAMRTNQSGEF